MSLTPPESGPTEPPTKSTSHLPRILCLHGGGVNASIFKAQMRSFLTHASLKSRFRFIFAEAPFVCEEAIGVRPVYADWGPFRRWFRWLPSQPEEAEDVCRRKVLDACVEAMEEDCLAGGRGEWVGILGFSQGAKMAVTLLYEMQIAETEGKDSPAMLEVGGEQVKWKMGILLAGRAPSVALTDLTDGFGWCQRASGLPDGVDLESLADRPEMRLRVPTVHVHGLKDEGLELHRVLYNNYCAPLSTTLVEWDGPHRVPLKKSDVDRVVSAIVDVADEYDI